MPYSGSIQIVNDPNGAAYAFLADNGLIWQCVWNAQAERWDRAQLVPGAEGGRELQVLVVEDLWPTSGVSGAQQGNSPGIVLAYRVGSGSNSKVVASLAGWGSDGALSWSEAVSLSNEQGNDEAFALVNGGNGRLRVVVQKREAETSAADLLLRLQEAPSELLSKELDQLASGTRPDSDLYVSDAQINADTDGGGYALQLSGNGATTSTALSPAAASATVNQPALPFVGTTELSRAALTANVVPPKSESSALIDLGATPVGVAAPTAGGNSGVPGLGFTRYAQNPTSLASLALFPTRYTYSSALGRELSSFGATENRAIDEYERSEVDPSEYGSSEFSSASFDDEATDRTESFANRSMLRLEAYPVLIDAFEEVVEPLEVIEDPELGGRLVNGASSNGTGLESLGTGLVLSGLFGGLLAGRGGYSVVNFTTLKYESGAESDKLIDQQAGIEYARALSQNGKPNLSTTNSGVGVGGSFKTLFQYSGRGFDQKLDSFTAQESVGLYGLLNQSKFRENYTLSTDASIAFSLLSEQRFSSSDGLPRALADIGLATGAAGDLLNLSQTIYGGYAANRVGLNTSNRGLLGTGGGLGRIKSESAVAKYRQGIGLLSTGLAVGSTVGVLASSMRNSGSFRMGVGFQEALELKLLSRYGVGVAAHLGSQQNWLWTLGDGLVKPDFQFLLFASAGAATIGGGYIPLINGSYVYNSNTQSDANSDNGTTAALEGTASAQPTSNGLLTLAPAGADAPFGYAPATASDSLLNSNGSPLASLTTRDSALFGFSLQSFDAGTMTEGVLSWGSKGSNLNDGNYSNVPLIGLSLPGSLPAVASFTVSNGSVDPTSLQVSVSDGAGQYLGLPSPSSGIYTFGIDVFAARAGNPAPPSAATMSSVLDAMPVINLEAASVNPGSPLQVTSLQRIQRPLPLSGLSQDGPYPLADGSAPAPNDLSVYTYSAVPVQLRADASDQEQVVLLNPDATATVKLSGGSIIAITLDQDLYFNDHTGSTYTVLIDLASKLPEGSIANPSVVVTAQNLSLNDFSEQDSFSANSSQQGAGVFLSSGPSDQLGLLPSFGVLPIQNRVSYVDGETIVYLNNTAGESKGWSAVYPSNVSLEKLYTNPSEYQFTTASSPTAITDQASDTTYVFWVEAANPVIPLTGSNGADNYQQFLDAYWNNQRINYSYATTSEIGSNTSWNYVSEGALYAPEGSIITDLRSFTVELDGKSRSLLVWTEVPIEGLQQALRQPDQLAQSQLAVIKTGLINPDANLIAGGYQWDLLFNDASGKSTISEVPWSAAQDSGLTISDLSAANLTIEIQGEAQLTPILSWSQAVRTPYNEAVLESNPVLFVPFAAWQPGFNTLNLGAAGGSNTETFASSTGLSSAVQGPLPKSAATAVLNEEGLGVLATGLGSFNTSLLQIARNAPQSSVEPVVALFEGSIADDTLTVTSLRQGTLKVGDLLVGDGVTANSTIKEVVTAATSSSPGTYRLDLSSTVATPTSLRTLTSIPNVPLSTFSGSFSGSGGQAGFTTLTLSGLVGSIQIGDRVLGLGLPGGVTVQEVTELDLDAGTATLVVDQGPATNEAIYGLASIPGGTSSPYTIEFWTQLAEDSNPAGAGLVGLGQASSTALPDRPVELPDGWLLSSGFAVERLTWQDALNQSLVSALPSDESASNLYGWRWGLVATGTNTTALDGTGGSNISRNALVLANLAVGDTIDGVNSFLANYGLSASDLTGIDGTPADQIASTPSTEFNFATDLVFNTATQAEVATTSLNAVSVLTDSALMNAGFLSAAEAQANSDLSTMLETLWTFQQETGEVKVNFDLKPTDPNTIQTPAKPPVSQQENYGGFALEFALLPGPAVSVNGNGQIAYDVADGITLLSDESVDYRDGQWHYVAVSFLPNYTSVVVADTLFEVPTNVGTANLYINGELVASQSNVIDPFAPINLNDNAQLLAENAGGAIDLLAFYDQALTTLQTPAAAEGWAMPTSTDALELIQEAGYVFEGRTPHPGEQPGAISNHYLAYTVDPNDALQATFTTVLMPQDGGGYSWSEATALSPQLDLRPTAASASNQNLADALLIPISAGDWQTAGWFVGSSSNAVPFNPANRELESITVALTPLGSVNAEVITRILAPSEVLLGSTSAGNLASLETVQPFSTNSTASLQYRFLSSQPALNLQISEAADSTGESGTLKPEVNYSAKVTFTFTDSTVVSNVSGDGSQGLALGFSPNVGSKLAFSPNFGSTLKSTVLYGPTALATAQVIEQAPLQLKYIDSGVQFASQVSPANPSPASTFGASQVYGSFADPVNSGLTAGWIAIAQPRSSNASSDPAGRVWIQYAGSFAFDSTTNQPEQVSTDIAPTTWLNALSTSSFSPDQPNLPLLSNAYNPSQVGGLLIKADPTDGWGQNLGANMLVADVNNDGVDDLVLSAPQANGGGAVVIIDGQWIHSNLTQESGKTILDLSNPDNLGAFVTILTPGVVDTDTDLVTVAGFGSALSFVPGVDGQAGYLLVGAPNYLRTLDSSDELASTQPIGALYSYQFSSDPTIWGSGIATAINPVIVGTGGTLTISQAGNGNTTDYWGAQLGTSIAVAADGRVAVSSPGVMGAAIYSGTEVANERVNQFKINATSRIPEGLLTQVQVGQAAINTTLGLNNPGLQSVSSLQEDQLSDKQIDFLNQVRDLQNSQVADATTLNNQAIQYGAFGAVTLFGSIAELQAMASGLNATDLAVNPAAVGAAGGQTFYGPNLFNTLGDSGFGSSLAFVDLVNSPNGSQLVVGAEQAGGGGMVYVLDPSLLNSATSLGNEQYLAFEAATNLISAAAEGDYLGSGLISLGDVNQDGYQDLLMQAYNADSSAGNAYLLFGSDQLGSTVANRGSASLATGAIGTMNFVDGSSKGIATLSQLGQAGSLAGQGMYGPGDYNADGYPDLPLGSGIMGKSYITYGQPYLEAINNLQLNRLTSNSGFMLDGLATTTQGSLRSIGDFNGDGYGDFMSINPGLVATTVRIELGANTQEILAEAPYNNYTFTVSLDTQVLSAGDLNGDGLDDIALFINSNLASEDDGNFGVGSTTGILYGRSSADLPVGSGFGFLSPVSPDGQPLRTLPSLPVAGGLSDVAPCFIAAGTTIYAAVKGNGASDTSIWFTQSKDSGSTWADWVDLSSADIGLSTSTTPSLALFNNTLYLGLATPDGVVVSSWDPASSDLTDWSQPQQVTTATTTLAPQLLDRGDSLGVIWVDQDGKLMASSSTEPGAQNVEWTTAIQLKSVASSGPTPITSDTAASYTWLGTTPVLAVNNNGVVEVYAAIGTGSGLQLISTFEAAQGVSTITSAPVITATDTGLALSYTNSDSSVSLARLNLLNDSGEPFPGVLIDANGSLSINTNDLTWSTTTLNAANSGISTSLATSPLSINGNLLLANIRTDTQFADQIWIDLIPNLADAAINPWINSTIQLPDGNGGWLISQTDANAASTLTAVGDLNGDGSDDLIVSNAVLSVAAVNTSNPWSALGNGASSLASPALAQLGDVLYMAVQSNTGGTNIYWSSSTDNGGSWADFQALPTDMTSGKPPSLAVFDGTLYLSYLGDVNNEINITSLTDPATNSWSEQYQIPWTGGTQSALYASLVTETVDDGNQLALYYISNDATQSELLRSATADPASSTGWSQQVNVAYNDGSANQTASGPLAVASGNGQTVIAYQGGTVSTPSNEIYFATSSTPSNSASWLAQSVLDPGQQTGLGLVVGATQGILLSYSDSTEPAALQLQSYEFANGSWNNTRSVSTPLMASGSNDVSILRSTATAAETIVFAGINASISNALEVKLASTSTSNTGLRLISGAGSAQAFAEINDATALQQTIQLAPALAGANGVGMISASVTAAGTLSLSAASTSDAYGVSASFSDLATLVASSDSISSSQQLFSNAFASEDFGWSSTPIFSPSGDLALNTTASFGDLNGDGYNDYFDPETSIWIASAPEAPVFSLWSIRAAGDVNGNGVDDVLLALTPQGPSYQAQGDGNPSAIYSALIDGALFNVTNNSFNLSDLKAALNPYISIELFDVTTTSSSDEYQSLQSWISPILKYQAPIEIDSVVTLVEGDSAYTQFATNATYNNSPAPTLVRDIAGNLYSITTQVIAGGDNAGVLLSNTLLLGVGQDSLDPNAINVTPIDLTQASSLTVGGEPFPSDSIAPLTPGAAIHDGRLFVAIPSARSKSGYGSSTNDIWIAYADLDNADKPLDVPSSWTTYQVQSNGGVTDENSLLTPTLVSEGERLALYFPSGSEGNNDVNLNVRYLYSNDPTQQAGWGSSLSPTTNTYTGISSTISIDASLSKTPSTGGWASESGVIVTSPIAATTYQGRTVLAFRGYADGGGDNVENGGLLLAFAPTARGAQANSTSSSSADWTLWDSGTTGINTPSIANDQANLYVTYTPWDTSATNAFSFPVALNIDQLSPNKQVDLSASNLVTAGDTVELPITLQQAGDDNTSIDGNNTNTGMTSPYYAGGYFKDADTQANNIGNAPQSVTPSFFGDALYVTNQVGESAAVAINYNQATPAFGTNQLNQAGLSLAGYSLDGNIDVNGDGFADILLSDPSDPSLAVNNQYVLFGGDYLDIASWVGTAGNDVAVGTPLADVIYTIAGDDVVTSNGGADVIYTGAGADFVSITGNSFIRIDAGSGIDQLLLEGDFNQDYDFALGVDSPDYFVGTKLRNIELISSLDYGANTLSFDPAAVSAFNDDRMLFVIPDASDTIQLYSDADYSFQRNSDYDTSFGGVVWSAFAAEFSTPGTVSNPALLYLLNPEPGNESWLDSNVLLLDSSAALPEATQSSSAFSSAPVISSPSPVRQTVPFGSGLSLTSFRTSPSDGLARFSVSSSDTSRPRALLYASSSANSSAEPGLHYTAVAGVAVLAKGQSSFDITVPINGEAFSQLRNGTLSLQVEEIPYMDQMEPIHLLIEPTPAAGGGLSPVLSGLTLSPASSGRSATLAFRADTNSDSADALNLSIAKRNSADAVVVSQQQVVSINDFKPISGDLPPAYNLQSLDQDGRPNQQVQTSLLLNLNPTGSDPLVSLLGPELNLQRTVQLLTGDQVRFQTDAPLTSWRADTGSGLVTFGLQSGPNTLTLITDASGGAIGSLNSTNANAADGWQTTEGRAIGSRSITDGQNLSGSGWTPTASREGVSLALLNLAVDGNQVTASFEAGVTGVFWQADGNAPSLLPVPVAVEVQRLGGFNNSLGFYSVDSITGMVDGLNPGEHGYLQAALARSLEEDLLLDARTLPSFGATSTFNSLPLYTRERYGVLLLQNGDPSVIFSSYAAANDGGATQMVSLNTSSNCLVLGIEDLSVANGLGDNDFNDIIVRIQGASLGLF